MKKLIYCLFASALVVLSAACDPIAEYNSGDKITISMKVEQISCGYAQVTFSPSVPAYYMACFEKVREGVDPFKYETSFKELSLDSAYVEYVSWRHDHLLLGEPYVSDFASHSLKYAETTVYKNFLDPDTDYWVYCFVVNPETNQPDGRLFCQTIHTTAESNFKTIRFDYRVSGLWDYIYPIDQMTGELVTNVPWVVETVDSLKLREMNYRVPGEYFDSQFNKLDNKSRIILGVYAHLNNGVGDGTSTTIFEKGHTYYTGMATLDGKRNECFDIYRFRWEGDDMELYLEDDQSTGGAW